jgi:hypothetical protein
VIAYFITKIIRLLQGSIIPIALLALLVTSFASTSEYKSWAKRSAFSACVLVGFVESYQFIESQLESVSNSIYEMADGNIATIAASIIVLLIYVVVCVASAIGWIGSVSSAFNFLFGKQNSK